MKKVHSVFSEAFFVCIHHKYAGRLLTVHKGRSPKQARNLFIEGALGGPYLMSDEWKKGGKQSNTVSADSAGDTAGLLMCCNKTAGGLLVQA